MPASTTQLLLQSRFAPHFSIQPLPAGGDATPVCPTIRDFLEVDPFEVSSSKIAVEGSSLIAKGSCCSSSGGKTCCSWLEWNTLHSYYECYTSFFGNIVTIIVRRLWITILCWSSVLLEPNLSLYSCHICLLVHVSFTNIDQWCLGMLFTVRFSWQLTFFCGCVHSMSWTQFLVQVE